MYIPKCDIFQLWDMRKYAHNIPPRFFPQKRKSHFAVISKKEQNNCIVQVFPVCRIIPIMRHQNDNTPKQTPQTAPTRTKPERKREEPTHPAGKRCMVILMMNPRGATITPEAITLFPTITIFDLFQSPHFRGTPRNCDNTAPIANLRTATDTIKPHVMGNIQENIQYKNVYSVYPRVCGEHYHISGMMC